jgi:hypothetical protein
MVRKGQGIEATWSRIYWRYIESVCEREKKMSPSARWEAIEREYLTGEITPGVYGFGFEHKGSLGRSSAKASRYMARNAAGYMAGNAGGWGTWHYVSTSITKETGVTMRALRSCNWLYVRRKLIEAGELDDTFVPFHWDAERTASVLRVWSLLAAPSAP